MLNWEGEQRAPVRLTTRGKVVVGCTWVAVTGLAGWFAPIGWWM